MSARVVCGAPGTRGPSELCCWELGSDTCGLLTFHSCGNSQSCRSSAFKMSRKPRMKLLLMRRLTSNSYKGPNLASNACDKALFFLCVTLPTAAVTGTRRGDQGTPFCWADRKAETAPDGTGRGHARTPAESSF